MMSKKINKQHVEQSHSENHYNKKILITGVSSGIGKYLHDLLSQDAYDIVPLTRQICDLEDNDAIRAFCQKIIEENISLDGLILNAGVGVFGPHNSVSDDDYQKMLQVNVYANILLVKYLLPQCVPGAKILFIGSRAGRRFMTE